MQPVPPAERRPHILRTRPLSHWVGGGPARHVFRLIATSTDDQGLVRNPFGHPAVPSPVASIVRHDIAILNGRRYEFYTPPGASASGIPLAGETRDGDGWRG